MKLGWLSKPVRGGDFQQCSFDVDIVGKTILA